MNELHNQHGSRVSAYVRRRARPRPEPAAPAPEAATAALVKRAEAQRPRPAIAEARVFAGAAHTLAEWLIDVARQQTRELRGEQGLIFWQILAKHCGSEIERQA